MKKYLLANSGHFYKANLHVHTTVSDGQMTPEEIKRIYNIGRRLHENCVRFLCKRKTKRGERR